MCGRFSVIRGEDVLTPRYEITRVDSTSPPSYNVAPSQNVNVVIRENPNILTTMRWGFIPFWAKSMNVGYNMINARSETVLDKPYFARAFLHERCLVPVTGFYEWKKPENGAGGNKIPYYIKIKSNDVFSFAGIYSNWRGSDDKDVVSFSILTTEPNELMKDIHDRMPVIIPQKDETTWLNLESTQTELYALLRAYDERDMETYPVSTFVNSPNNDSEECIRKLDPHEVEQMKRGISKEQQSMDDFF